MSDPGQANSEFEQRAKGMLDAGEAQLTPEVLRDLHRARQRALATLQKPRAYWQPVALLGAIAMLVLVIINLQPAQVKPPATPGAMEDMTILSAGDNLDLYENLDFYQWLDEEKHNS